MDAAPAWWVVMPWSIPPGPGPGSPARGPRAADWVQTALLLALAHWTGRANDLMVRLRQFGVGAIDHQAFVAALGKAQHAGLVAEVVRGSGDVNDGPIYRLTDAGMAHLNAWSGVLEAQRAMLDAFFDMYGPPGQPNGDPRGDR